MAEKRQQLNLFVSVIILGALFLFLGISSLGKIPSQTKSLAASTDTLWQYQCIDTMKTSRDRARNYAEVKEKAGTIADQVAAIKALGANCIAIDTPYDSEFLPYLKHWVSEARKENLMIWFRGNFSGWEGWFSYPTGMSSQQLFDKTKNFITSNPDLFQDGDIFTPAPEAENGGPFNQVEPDEYTTYRQFLLQERKTARDAFVSINKNVTVNWMSMNGGLAKRMLDKPTVSDLGNLVTIDHYIKTAPEMGEYINYFHKKFDAKVAIGEFGAPIPDINGSMTEQRQADFVTKLFDQLYRHKDQVAGVNYWVLYDSSTALYNEDFTPRPVTKVIEQYFKPNRVDGMVTDDLGSPINGVVVKTNNGANAAVTDSQGKFSMLIPNDQETLVVRDMKYQPFKKSYSLSSGNNIVMIHLTPKKQNFFYKLRQILPV